MFKMRGKLLELKKNADKRKPLKRRVSRERKQEDF